VIVLKVLGGALAGIVAVWLGAVLFSAGQEVLRAYRKAAHEQDMHYRGWMR